MCISVLSGGLGCSQVDRRITRPSIHPLAHTPTAHAVPAAHGHPTNTADWQNGQSDNADSQQFPDSLEAPFVLTVDNIIRLVHAKSPSVRAAREEMEDALQGLKAFEFNLNWLEQFTDIRSDAIGFSNHELAEDLTNEVKGDKEKGGGMLVLSRTEAIPFGSGRRRNWAGTSEFQKWHASQAKLHYLEHYRACVENALFYYHLTMYYQRLASAHQRFVEDLDSLINDQRLKEEDRERVESVRAEHRARRERHAVDEREYRLILMSELGIAGDQEFELKVSPDRLGVDVMRSASPEWLDRLLEEACKNNPTFRVLNDAIRDTEFQCRQATKDTHEVAAFVEVAQFPLGTEMFDERLDGRTTGPGLTFQPNDNRVAKASRLKAESQIRQFRARLDAEEITTRRRIITETEALKDNDKQRTHLLNVIEQKQAEFARRLKDYFQNQNDVDIDHVLDSRREVVNAEVRLSSTQYNSGNREARLMGTTGRVYKIVGLKIGEEEDPRSSN
jgi:hypothetical protein